MEFINYILWNSEKNIKFYLLSDVINIICINFVNIEIQNIQYIIELILEELKIFRLELTKIKNKKKICDKCVIF